MKIKFIICADYCTIYGNKLFDLADFTKFYFIVPTVIRFSRQKKLSWNVLPLIVCTGIVHSNIILLVWVNILASRRKLKKTFKSLPLPISWCLLLRSSCKTWHFTMSLTFQWALLNNDIIIQYCIMIQFLGMQSIILHTGLSLLVNPHST